MKLKSRTSIAVATAMALGCGVAQAAVLSATPAVYSQQGQALSGTTAAQQLPTLTVTLGADYSVNDNITLRIAGATVGGDTNANLSQIGAITCVGDPIIVSFITRNGNDILLRVTQKNVVNTVGEACTIDGIEVTAPSLAVLTEVTATWNATTAITNIPFDPSNTVELAEVIDQFGTGVTQAFNGVVDVNDPSLRRSFTTDDSGFWGTDDLLIVNTIDRAGLVNAGPVATLNTVTAVVNGDISFLDNDNNGCTLADFGAGAGRGQVVETGPGAGVPAVSANCQTTTWTYTPAVLGENVLHGIFFGNDRTVTGARTITAPQQFTGSVRYQYSLGAATGEETDAAPLGEWTLNGFSAFVPYMPYADGISQIIYLTNKSAQSGTITVDAYNQAGVACSFDAGTMQGGRVTILTGAVKAGLEGCYGVGFNDRVSMTVVVNIPAGRAELVTAYNVNGDRVQVINTSNGRITQGGNSTTGGQL